MGDFSKEHLVQVVKSTWPCQWRCEENESRQRDVLTFHDFQDSVIDLVLLRNVVASARTSRMRRVDVYWPEHNFSGDKRMKVVIEIAKDGLESEDTQFCDTFTMKEYRRCEMASVLDEHVDAREMPPDWDSAKKALHAIAAIVTNQSANIGLRPCDFTLWEQQEHYEIRFRNMDHVDLGFLRAIASFANVLSLEADAAHASLSIVIDTQAPRAWPRLSRGSELGGNPAVGEKRPAIAPDTCSKAARALPPWP